MQRESSVSMVKKKKNSKQRWWTETQTVSLDAYDGLQMIMNKYDIIFLTWFATTASCGSSGSAAARRACRDNSTVRRVIAAALGEAD